MISFLYVKGVLGDMFDMRLKWDMEMQVDRLSFFISLSGIDIEKG